MVQSANEEPEQKRNQREHLTVASREEDEYWVGFHDTPEDTEEFEQLQQDIATEQGVDFEAELKM